MRWLIFRQIVQQIRLWRPIIVQFLIYLPQYWMHYLNNCSWYRIYYGFRIARGRNDFYEWWLHYARDHLTKLRTSSVHKHIVICCCSFHLTSQKQQASFADFVSLLSVSSMVISWILNLRITLYIWDLMKVLNSHKNIVRSHVFIIFQKLQSFVYTFSFFRWLYRLWQSFYGINF